MGGTGGPGGLGGPGGSGGGILILAAHHLSGSGRFAGHGARGSDGSAGGTGGQGGAGGRGSNRRTVQGPFGSVIHPAKGGGGGGKGGTGGQAGAGGGGGHAGSILLMAVTSSFSGTAVCQGGLAGGAGTPGAGGPGGGGGAAGTGEGLPTGAGSPGGAGTGGLAAPAAEAPGAAGSAVILLSPPSYPVWQARMFSAAELNDPALSAATADADGDGLSNLLEFACNLDPRSAGQHALTGNSGLPVHSIVPTPDGPRLTLAYLRRKAAGNPGITTQAVFSSALDDTAWEAAASEVVTSLDETWERVTATDPAPAGAARRFGRVAVNLLP